MKKVWTNAGMLLFAAAFLLAVFSGRKVVYAEAWDDAYAFYLSYGNQTVFRATSQTDGQIYCATRGAVASTGTTYRTVGWKMDVEDSTGRLLQSIYFQLGGAYLNNINTVQVKNYIYRLYAISLQDIKSRMNESAGRAMEQGNCQISLNACMTVVINGVPQGSISDQGIAAGKVYTTYDGIVSAANWAAASRTALTSYYDKKVEGLFYSVSVNKGSGIASVSGGGTYCYGTYVTISAAPLEGYAFSNWSGTDTVYSESYGFYVNGDKSWTAVGTPEKITVTFYRNSAYDDTVSMQQSFTHGIAGQRFVDCGFSRTGYHQLGWAHTANAAAAQYTINNEVSSEWIRNYHPSVSLYAVWEINSYQIAFDGNGATAGSVAAITTYYGKTETMPENGFENPAQSTFLGWSLSKDSLTPEYKAGDNASVSLLVKQSGVEYDSGASITLYAVWDYAPEIKTDDLFYSLMDARSGTITEEELGGRAEASDREDGIIPYGGSAANSFRIIDYNPEEFTGCTSDAVAAVTYEAVDSAGNHTERSINVYIVDTSIQEGSAVTGRIRLIDLEYFEDEEGNLVPETAGGLKSVSRWSCDVTWRTLLRETLQRAKLPASSPEA